MLWNVEGADVTTGAERVVSVTADSAEDAERLAGEQGMLVSAVFASTITAYAAPSEPAGPPAPPPPSVPYRSAPVASTPPLPQPAAPRPRGVPAYHHLRIAAVVLGVLAGCAYVSGVISAGFAAVKLAGEAGRFSVDGASDVSSIAWELAQLASPLVAGALLHAAAAGCAALRDVARNSYRSA